MYTFTLLRRPVRNLQVFLLMFLVVAVSCNDDDYPPLENQEETVTRVRLSFTNLEDPTDSVTAQWLDADGEGSGDPVVDDILLRTGTPYTLKLSIQNTLETPVDDITSEIRSEADEHKFFFSFTSGIFTDPAGDGNVDQYDDPVNYADQDTNGLPLGLSTDWTTGDPAEGNFRVLLKHQPDIKSATSTSTDGESDLDVTFSIRIE